VVNDYILNEIKLYRPMIKKNGIDGSLKRIQCKQSLSLSYKELDC